MSVMKDLVYEQDYKAFNEQFPDVLDTDIKKAARDADNELTLCVRKRFMEMPHIILPEGKENFDACEGKLDRLALTREARIRSVISYVNYDARIILEMPNASFVKFSLEVLDFVTKRAQWIKFETAEDGWIRMIVNIAYFANIGDTSAVVRDEMDNHPEVTDLNDASYEEEKSIMLNKPELSDGIAAAAEQVGLTPDEWYDRMEAFLQANPQIYEEFIEEALKKKRDKLRREVEPETYT